MQTPKLLDVEARPNFKLFLSYSDGTTGELDVTPTVEKKRYKLFEDQEYFGRAHIENNAIVWDERMDMCGDYGYMKLKGTL